MRLHPLSYLALLGLGACSSLFGDPDAGRDEDIHVRGPHGRVEGRQPNHARSSRAVVLRSFAYRALERGLVKEAKHHLQEACEIDPNDVASHAALARLFMAEGKPDLALAYARVAAQIAPEDPEINLVYAAALAENDSIVEATAVLEKVWKVTSGRPEFARAMLVHYAASGGDALARRFVEKILAEQPDNPIGYALAGDAFLAEGDLEKAAAAYRKALAADPTTPTPKALQEQLGIQDEAQDMALSAAMDMESAGDLLGAERLFRYLTAEDPESKTAHAGLARVLFRQERLEEARSTLSKVPLSVRNWRDHLLQAKIDIKLGNWIAARSALLLANNERPGLRAAQLLLEFVERKIETVVETQEGIEDGEGVSTAPDEDPFIGPEIKTSANSEPDQSTTEAEDESSE